MSVDFLVLLLALEMKDKDLIGTAAFHDLAAHHSPSARADCAFLGGNSKNVIEFNGVAVSGGQLFHFHYVAGCDAVLLSPGANYRVHTLSIAPSKRMAQKDLINL